MSIRKLKITLTSIAAKEAEASLTLRKLWDAKTQGAYTGPEFINHTALSFEGGFVRIGTDKGEVYHYNQANVARIKVWSEDAAPDVRD